MPLPNCTLQQQSLAAMLANVNLPQTQCYIGCAAPLKSRTPGLPFIGQTSYVCLLIAARLCMYVSHTYIRTDSTTSTVHIMHTAPDDDRTIVRFDPKMGKKQATPQRACVGGRFWMPDRLYIRGSSSTRARYVYVAAGSEQIPAPFSFMQYSEHTH
jgi:hypothetical protein